MHYTKIKNTLMENGKYLSMFVFISKQYPANFAFPILRIPKLFMREICKLLKNYANFSNILLFLNVCK